MTKSFFASLALVVSFAVTGLAGCSVDSAPSKEALLQAVDPSSMRSYVPNVTYKDLRDANASCRGSYCTINGTSWSCAGGGKCTKM